MITLLNTPERIKRINSFQCKLVIQNVEGENTAVIAMSEEVIITPDSLAALDTLSDSTLAHSAATAPAHIEERLTSLMKSLLLYGKAWFVGEIDADIVTDMGQVVQGDDDGLVIYHISEGD